MTSQPFKTYKDRLVYCSFIRSVETVHLKLGLLKTDVFAIPNRHQFELDIMNNIK